MVGSFKQPQLAPFPWDEVRESARRDLRRQFAGMAMQGLLASQGNDGKYYRDHEVVQQAVWFADALLAELDKETGHEMD